MWITWYDGVISLGRRIVNNHHIASITDPYGKRQYKTLHMFNHPNNMDSGIEFEFDIDAGKFYSLPR